MRWIELTLDAAIPENKPILVNLDMITDILPVEESSKPGTYITILNRHNSIIVKEIYDEIVDTVYSGREFNDY